jgi:competence protein ComEC
MSLIALSICIILAVVPLLWLPALPDLHLTQAIAFTGAVCAWFHYRPARLTGFWLLFFAWGLLAAQAIVWPMTYLTRGQQSAEVVITASDGKTTHQAKIIRINGKRLFPAAGVKLYGSALPQAGCAGQRWKMTLRMRPVHGQLNEGGFDSQRHALAQHLPLTGRFTHAEVLDARCSLRARYLASLSTTLAAYRWGPVMLGLGMGERLSVTQEITNLMRETGTAHLMAISGLHIALAASVIWLLVRGLQYFIPAHRIGWRSPLVAGFCFAAFYAWLTGMQPPALRTVVSLGVCLALQLGGRCWSSWQIWLLCVAAILLVDPLAVLSHSLLLSAFAVAALIFWFQWLPLPKQALPKAVQALVNLLHLQLGMLLLLLPLQVALFHGFSLSSLAANLVAVPLVTFVAVPLILLGMLCHLVMLTSAESGLWMAADAILSLLFGFLKALPDGWVGVDKRWTWLAFTPWLAIIGWRMRVWRISPALCLAAMMVFTFPLWRARSDDGWALHMLDVGQGLAMVIERQGRAVLYDTGPAWPGGDSAQHHIVPWLRWHNLRPDGVILSHDHLDHSGGLETIRKTWPEIWIRSPLRQAGHIPCFRGERWQWQGLTFTAHWPPDASRWRGNNGSCVVKVDDGVHSVLLTGDIEAEGEKAMLSRHWQYLMSTLIQVPHHGSNTSSTLPLVQRVNGRLALVSASRFNAWRLPSVKIANRYRKEGYQWFSTPQSGQITVTFSPQEWQILRLRYQYFPRWYHQWFGVPGDNG